MSPGERLARWFRDNARELPWRTAPRDPYRVLVSEVMLQQTQVDRVAPRFEAFLSRFPDLETLAAAGEEEVLEAWSGLGYYRRARALHRLAREAVVRGGLPSTAGELRDLPGIGPYTAAAVASLAWGERVPVLDGNVLRVGARVLGLAQDPRAPGPRRAIAAWVESLMGEVPPAVVNEALMELGATVCSPRAPGCSGCPLAAACSARASGRQEEIPPPRRTRKPEPHRWAAAVVISGTGRWLLDRVEGGPVLQGLWLPPLAMGLGEGDDPVAAAESAAGLPLERPETGDTVRHTITHRRITVVPVVWRLAGEPRISGRLWADPAAPGVPTSSLLGKLARAVDAEG